MLNRLRGILGTAATAMEIAYKLSQGLDYKTLNKYILKINRLSNVEDILSEASQCLKDILNYDIFAFGLNNSDTLNVWIDPRIEEKRLVERIQADLCSQNCDIKINHFIEKINKTGHFIDADDINSMLSFDVNSEKYSAKLYILPGRKMLRYHDEIIEAVLNAVSIALDNAISMKQLESAAFIDILTGCYNRRALNSYIDHDIADAQRYGRDLSVIMFDIDYFKRINDAYGHEAGDIVLSAISGMIAATVRKSDYLARYGGEEFMLVLSNTELSKAADLAERLRKKIEACKISIKGMQISVTASFGVAAVKGGYNRAQLFLDADRMLYRAKAGGRNVVVHEQFSLPVKSLLLQHAAC